MSETLEAPVVETNDAPADRFAGVEFGSETQTEQPKTENACPSGTAGTKRARDQAGTGLG